MKYQTKIEKLNEEQKNAILAEIEQARRGNLKKLYNEKKIKYDISKLYKISGGFTVAGLDDLLFNKFNINLQNYNYLYITRNDKQENGGGLVLDVYLCGLQDFSKYSYYWQFDKVRQEKNRIFYLLLAKKQEAKQKNNNFDVDRFKLANNWSDKYYINTTNGNRYEISRGHFENNIFRYDAPDKSGYFNFKIDQIKDKANQIKREKQAAAVANYDFTQNIDELNKLKEQEQQKFLKLAKNCKTSQDFKAFEDVTHSFYNYFDDLERLTKKAKNKNFDSLEKFNKDFNELKNGVNLAETLKTRKKFFYIDFIEKDIKAKTNGYFYLSYSDKNIKQENNILTYTHEETGTKYQFNLLEPVYNFEAVNL